MISLGFDRTFFTGNNNDWKIGGGVAGGLVLIGILLAIRVSSGPVYRGTIHID